MNVKNFLSVNIDTVGGKYDNVSTLVNEQKTVNTKGNQMKKYCKVI